MTVLEQRYRVALRMLPASYRLAWEEDMVATFLASAATDDADDAEYLAAYGRPSWSEVASVAMLAVRLRVGGAGTPPLSVAWGEVVRALRLVALTELLLSAVLATWAVWTTIWLAIEISWLPAPAEFSGPPLDFWQVVRSVVTLLWVMAYLALVFGHWRAARLLTVLAFVPWTTSLIWNPFSGGPVLELLPWAELLVNGFLLLTLATFHRDTPPVRRRPWLIAFAVGIALTPVLELVIWTIMLAESQWLLDMSGLYCVLIVVAALVYLAGRRRTPAWALALALHAFAGFVVRAVSLWHYATSGATFRGSSPMILGVVQTLTVLAVGLLLAALANRGLRRFPSLDPAASPTLDR